MNTIMDSLDEVFFEACKMKGFAWVHEEPLWCTWSLEKFGKSYVLNSQGHVSLISTQ